MNSNKTIVWQIEDGKPGHVNQLRGLTNALAEIMPLDVHTLATPTRRQSLAALWTKQFPSGKNLPTPHLILGAGHATHFAVLAARRARGGRAIVLMKPSLPPALFDLCLVPEHDQVTATEKIITTRGVLNVVRPSRTHDAQSGLILIGGPSSAHGWSDNQMIKQIATVMASDSAIRWTLTTSRRTPSTFLTQLNCQSFIDLAFANLQIVSHEQTAPGWLPTQLAQADQVWVSEDSVSMVYESLTSGAAVGVLEVPCQKRGRVAAGVDKLIADGWATRFSEWQSGQRLSPPPEQLDEARRCAEIISGRFFSPIAA